MRKRITVCLLLILCLTFSVFTTSCGLIKSVVSDGESSTTANGDNTNIGDNQNAVNPGTNIGNSTTAPGGDNGVSDDTDSGKTENNYVTNNNVTISGTTDNIAYAAAVGLRSAVSVYCSFEMTYITGNPWYGTPVTKTYYSTGSGVVYRLENDGSAFVITNYHVVYDADSNESDHISKDINLFLYGLEATEYAIPARFIGGSANYDIAVLRVDKSSVLKDAISAGSVAAVSIGNSDNVVPGMTTLAIGNPATEYLSGISVTQGIVSVDSEYISMSAINNSGEVSFRVIRTDTPINSGNSGGGLYNGKGELVGIVNAKINNSSVENIGYAIPSNVVRGIADNIIYYCYNTECTCVMRGMLGVTVKTAALYTKYDPQTGLLTKHEKIRIYEITSGGLADGALLNGDILKSITIAGKTTEITRSHHVIDAMLDVRVGDTVVITVDRDVNGTVTTLEISMVVTENCLVEY